MYTPGWNVRQTAPYGLLILRVVVGIVIALHGWAKLSGGVDGVAGFFGGMLGIPAPGFFAWVVTIVELLGGILLVIGALTQIVGILLAIDMLGAIVFAYFGRGAPLINENGFLSWELEVVIGAAALSIALAGAGAFSVDQAMEESRLGSGSRARAA